MAKRNAKKQAEAPKVEVTPTAKAESVENEKK
jgi:hypothetical protein